MDEPPSSGSLPDQTAAESPTQTLGAAPEPVGPAIALASVVRALLAAGRAREALDLLRSGDRSDAELRRLEVVATWNSGLRAEAMELLDELRTGMQEADADLLRLEYSVRLAAGTADALQAAERWRAKVSDDPNVTLAVARAALRAGQVHKAAAALDAHPTAAATDPVLRGRVALAGGRLAEAERAFREHLEDAADLVAQLDLPLVLRRAGRLPDALAAARDAVVARPREPAAHWRLAGAADALLRPGRVALLPSIVVAAVYSQEPHTEVRSAIALVAFLLLLVAAWLHRRRTNAARLELDALSEPYRRSLLIAHAVESVALAIVAVFAAARIEDLASGVAESGDLLSDVVASAVIVAPFVALAWAIRAKVIDHRLASQPAMEL